MQMKNIFKCFFATLITLIFISPCFQNENVFNNKINNSIRIVYIDDMVSDYDKNIIIESANEWEFVTNGIVKFYFINKPDDNIDVNVPLDTDVARVTVTSAQVSSILVEIMDVRIGSSLLGLYDRWSDPITLYVVPERFNSDEMFKSVMLHEWGHSFYMEHLIGKDAAGTLMYPSYNFGADCITQKDAEEFCDIYNCNAEELNYCYKEPNECPLTEF
jgi:hypothetical protein